MYLSSFLVYFAAISAFSRQVQGNPISDSSLTFEDISEIHAEAKAAAQGRAAPVNPLTFNSYPRYADILRYLSFLEQNSKLNGRAQITIESVGKSFEGRMIPLVKISDGKGVSGKQAVWMDGGMHAREWISPVTVLYMMDILASNSTIGRQLVEKFDWYVVPVINLDGYEFTHSDPRNRLWRKTRSTSAIRPGCIGTDPNRNWGFHWGEVDTSKDPCAQTYGGPRAFSEPETLAVANAIYARRNDLKMYLTFHSYSQILLVPWGYKAEKPTDYQKLLNLARKGQAALQATSGTRYTVGTAADTMYVSSGASDDWAKGVAGIEYSYTFELRDTGVYQFELPTSMIIPVGRETFNAVRAMALALSDELDADNADRVVFTSNY